LWGFGLVVVTLGLSFARQRSLRLVRRARFLLIVLVVLFAFYTWRGAGFGARTGWADA
jgi:hypothetical protein